MLIRTTALDSLHRAAVAAAGYAALATGVAGVLSVVGRRLYGNWSDGPTLWLLAAAGAGGMVAFGGAIIALLCNRRLAAAPAPSPVADQTEDELASLAWPSFHFTSADSPATGYAGTTAGALP
jgi:hypothetical protein